MGSFKHVLVPVDFGGTSSAAVDAAIDVASRFDAKVTLLHVYLDPIATYGYAEGIYWPVDEIARAARTELDALVKKAKARHPAVEGLLMAGDPARQIVAASEANAVDLVVMGTHGRRGLARWVLGSVAEKVVRLSAVPVMTVRGPAEEPADAAAEERTW